LVLADRSLDQPRIVFGPEMSRLTRSNNDCRQLRAMSAWSQALQADADGV
jgi:hypothetical protein